MGKKSSAPTPAAMDAKWQAQNDLRTLTDARDIQRDTKRMGGVRREARKVISVTKRVLGGSR